MGVGELWLAARAIIASDAFIIFSGNTGQQAMLLLATASRATPVAAFIPGTLTNQIQL